MRNIISLVKNNIFYICAIIISLLVALYFWLVNLPFPLLLSWDIYEHQNLINLIGKGNINFFTSKISDTFTFNSYPPTFHILILFLQKLFFVSAINSANFWYLIQIVYFILVTIVQGLLAYSITKNKQVMVITTIIGVFVFESFGSYTSLFLIPQTLTALIYITLLYLIFKTKNLNRKYLYASFTLLLPFFHYIIGSLAVAITLGILILDKINNIRVLKRVLSLLIIGLIIIIVFYKYIEINPLSSREESIDYLLTLKQKLWYTEIWYGYFFYVFGFFGIVKTYLSQKKSYLMVAIISLVLFIAYIYPFPYTSKFWVIGRYFINILLGVGFYSIYKHIIFKKIALVLLIATLAFIFYYSQLWYKNIPNITGNYISHYSPLELESSKILVNIYKNNNKVLLVSDPSTQYILESFSEINSQGGTYMLQKNRKVLAEIPNLTNQEDIANSLFTIKDELKKESPEKIIFILSGRYFAWQNFEYSEKLKFAENVWYPLPLKDKDRVFIQWLKANPRFNEVYSNEEMIILEVSK